MNVSAGRKLAMLRCRSNRRCCGGCKQDIIAIGFKYTIVIIVKRVQFSKANDKEELKAIVESYQESLRNKTNPKNLKKFVEAFLKWVLIQDSKYQCEDQCTDQCKDQRNYQWTCN